MTITSPRPNTTRRSVRGVLHRPGVQAVFVDTPGLHRPRTALGTRLNEQVGEALDDIDVVVPVLDATAPIGPGDRLVSSGPRHVPRTGRHGRHRSRCRASLVVVNKVDRATRGAGPRAARGRPRASLEGERRRTPGSEYFPVSAATGAGGRRAGRRPCSAGCPRARPTSPRTWSTDVPEAFWVAELVREQLLAHVREELPHSIACRVTEWEWPRVRIEILVERESQKGIVIGKGGAVLKDGGHAPCGPSCPPGAFVELGARREALAAAPRHDRAPRLLTRTSARHGAGSPSVGPPGDGRAGRRTTSSWSVVRRMGGSAVEQRPAVAGGGQPRVEDGHHARCRSTTG